MQVSTMTNGSVAITQGLLQRANLEQYVSKMMDITQPQAWKPSPKAYHYAVEQLGLQPEQVVFACLLFAAAAPTMHGCC